jgi:DNA-binding response OmpR family regulator
MKILIVEDDALIAYQIKECVQKLDHEVLGSFDEASSALAFVAQNIPDFVFMDIELNGAMDGIQCAGILKHKYDVPSIFVTSHDEAQTIKEATDLGPLNFLPKPFTDKNIEVAVALAGIALKKHQPLDLTTTIRTLGAYAFNFEYNTLKFEDRIVKLSPNESKLVSLLFKNLGNTISNEEIQTYIWGDKSISSAAFRKLISRSNEALVGLEIVPESGMGYCIREKL